MKNKIAIIKSGFMVYYLDEFIKICNKNGISTDVFSDENPFKEDMKSKYDYVYSDCQYILGGASAFHSHSIIERMNRCPFLLYKFIFYLGHISKIKKTQKDYSSLKKIIVVSNNMKNDFANNYNIPKNNIIVAHAGFVPNENNKNKKFKPYNKENDFIVSISANGFVTKGGYNLLRALRKFRKLFPDIKIKANIIYPRYKKNLTLKMYMKIFKLNSIVEFFDYQKDMSAFYEKSNCHICASNYEPFGRVVTEAMNEKVPIIVASSVGAADIIKDGINGFIFENNKNCAINLALKIKEVYDKSENLTNIVEEAYSDSKKLTWDNFAQELFNGLYKSK